ncbi:MULTISPECIES: DUF6542 domain-containing protein [Streptomyces]|uniref:DUF6542 domain-containing protein n=2 Tax=Streptomyces TaxID=1883 RepID=UPI001F6051B5|nr:DUF6542 domain-containing protein [Streptomyces sp. MMS20-AI2-20]MCI4141546.1 hypothetical protein [Streptomyces sp. MMS20-AI2-20]
MEQHRTRPAQYGPRHEPTPGPSAVPRTSRPPGPPLPPQAGRTAGGGVARSPRAERSQQPQRPQQPQRSPRPAGRRPAPPPPARQVPGPRLTGLGGGLFCGAVMLVLGLLTEALFGSSLTVYGVLFLPVCVLTALWVREGDLLIAPVVVPIAFAVGLVPVADEGGGSTADRLMGLVTGLATQAGWLYGGTLLAGVLVIVRRVRRVRRVRTANRRPAGNRAGRAGRAVV